MVNSQVNKRSMKPKIATHKIYDVSVNSSILVWDVDCSKHTTNSKCW